MSQVQIVASRGTETLADSLQCVSNAGGKIWGNLEVTGTLKSSNTYTKTEVNNITDTKVDLDGGNYIGSELEDVVEQTHWMKKITNCLLEVPQRINLELTDSGLTLKAGSVVIVPNGADGYKEVTVASDMTMTLTAFTGSEQFMLFYNATATGGIAGIRLASQVASGAITPTSGNWTYYNTNDNYVYVVVSGEIRDYKASFPFGLITVTDGTITSIDQVFNGMGYIGSTVWVDKGVKVLIPDGRNEDGSLKNIEFEVPSLIIGSRDLTQEFIPVWYQSNNTIVFSKGWEYVEATNKVTAIQDGVTTRDFCQIATVNMDAGVISNFQPKLPFHAPDIQDVVRKTGDTMSGVLELYGTSSHLGLFGGSIFTHNMNISMDTAPSSNIYFPVVEHQDKNNTRKSRIESFFKADGSHGFQITEANNGNYSAICAGFDANGDAYTYAPHCAVTNGIVTQAGLSKAGNGYVKFGNGIIIQWGYSTATTATKVTTLPTAFTSTNYRVVGQHYYANGNGHDDVTLTALTKTSFTMWGSQASKNVAFHWIAVGY